MTWNGPTECPGCGATIGVGIMSLSATCKFDGFYFVDIAECGGWYTSQDAYMRGDAAIRLEAVR